LYVHGFRFYFTPLSGVLFAFPSRYWFTIGRQEYLALEDGPPTFRQDNTCPALLVFTTNDLSCTGLSPTIAALSRAVPLIISCLRAIPRSLAATEGISIDFFSFGYLDVSVPRVRLHTYVFRLGYRRSGGFPHSEIPGSKPVCQLPEAYRRLLRPSSPLSPRHPPCALIHLTI
jgi:hypothetical protein